MVLDNLFNNFRDNKKNFSSTNLYKREEEEEELTFKKKKPFKLPNIDININNDKTPEKKEEEEVVKEEEPTTKKEDGDGFDIKLPETNIPEVDIEIHKVDIPKLPEAEVTIQDIKIADIDVQPIADTFIDTAEKAYTETKDFVEPLLNTIGEEFEDKVIDPTASATEQLGKMISDTAKPVNEILEKASEPVAKVINESLKTVKDLFEDSEEYVSENTSIIKGDGTGYGEVSLGDSGFAVDASKVMDNSLAYVTQGSQLEGVSGRDMFDIVTDPNKFVQNKTEETAKDVFTNNLGLDEGFAGDIVQAISKPEEFIKDKGEEVATDFVKQTLNIDDSMLDAGIDILTTGNIDKAAKTIARAAVTETTLNVVSAIPVVGAPIAVIARIFRYSCYLSTGAYFGDMITKKQYLEFTRYRINIQSKELTSQIVWIGYQLAFKPICLLMMRYKPMCKFFTHLWVNPWYRYIKAKNDKIRCNNRDLILAKSIKYISILTFFALFPISLMKIKELRGINVMNTYRNIIRLKEYGYVR